MGKFPTAEERIEANAREAIHPRNNPDMRLVPMRKMPGAKWRLKLLKGSGVTPKMLLKMGEVKPHGRKTWAEKRTTTGKRRSH